MNKLIAGVAVLAIACPLSAVAQGAAAQSAASKSTASKSAASKSTASKSAAVASTAPAASASAASASAGSPFDGTWKANPKTITWSGKPTVYDLNNGEYSCSSCVPPVKVKADGAPHPYVGNPYIDTLAVTVVDDHTIRSVGAKGGKERGVQTMKVSADGNTLTVDFKGRPLNPGGAAVVTSRTYARVSPAAVGAHAISGSWERKAMTAMAGAAGVNVFHVEGDMLHWSSPSGASYVAGFDGKPYPIKGDPGATSVTLHKVSATRIVETDWRNGKKVDVTTWSISPSGKTLTMTDNDQETGVVTTEKATKQ